MACFSSFFCSVSHLPAPKVVGLYKGYVPPTTFWAPIITGRWIIPGYDQVFVAPICTFLVGPLFLVLVSTLERSARSFPADRDGGHATGRADHAAAIETVEAGTGRTVLFPHFHSQIHNKVLNSLKLASHDNNPGTGSRPNRSISDYGHPRQAVLALPLGTRVRRDHERRLPYLWAFRFRPR